MKKTILVTGGTGFLGRRLGMVLKDKYRVVLTGRNNKQNAFAQKYTGCEVLPMDIVNIEGVRRSLSVSGEFRNVDQIGNLIINGINGKPVYLKNISLVFWSKRKYLKDILKKTDL